MRINIILILVAVLLAIGLKKVSAHNINCFLYDQYVQGLWILYQEQKVYGGLINDKIYELWVNEEKGTWTMLYRTGNNVVCPFAAGENLRKFDLEPLGEDG